MKTKQKKLSDRFWKDKNNKVVIGQTPNAYLISWAVLTLASLFINGSLSTILEWLGILALTIWAFLEIIKGVNFFRKIMGSAVLVLILLTAIHLA
jgi:hypothetical protein